MSKYKELLYLSKDYEYFFSVIFTKKYHPFRKQNKNKDINPRYGVIRLNFKKGFKGVL